MLFNPDREPSPVFPNFNWEDCVIQLFYKVNTPSLPNGELVFNLQPVLNNTAPSDFLTDISFALQ